MELPGTSYLLAVATLSITFVSVSSIAFVFRQALGTGLSELEIVLIRVFLRTGLGVTIFALLPLLLGLLGVLPALAWRVSSLLLALAHLNGLIGYLRRRAHFQHVATPLTFYSLYGVSMVVILGLLLNAIGIGVEPGVGLYALAVTWILVEAILMFIGALRIFLEPLQKK